ncbi:MAG: uroporphyrinogen decarboxylase [Pseudobdellovibrionaceae bacterium]|nr:uroporphyrinogen decarboxylase [Bdellovibrionales bacterium]USN48705.1 MAG: uroporphyrinogen decarboxylase [Pseudobdellovibrionaceae bacterium]
MANDLFKAALSGEPVSVPPIWFMRQAGRYHSHYQNLRSRYSFMDLCKVPELAAEVAYGPVAEFDFDVSIMFSDLLFPLEAFGMGLTYEPGPVLGWKLNRRTLKDLKSVDEALPLLQFQGDVLRATRQRLPQNKSLIGFIGGPWTLYTYAVEGGHKGALTEAKADLTLFTDFTSRLLPLLQENIRLQLNAGAEIVMIFDTAAGELSPSLFNSLVVPELEKLSQSFPGRLGYYSKLTDNSHLRPRLWQDPNWAGFGVDHRWNVHEVLAGRNKSVGPEKGFVQGNFDQALLFSEPEQFKKVLGDYLNPLVEMSPEQRRGWVCGLGHGILPQTPEKHVHLFIETVRKRFS